MHPRLLLYHPVEETPTNIPFQARESMRSTQEFNGSKLPLRSIAHAAYEHALPPCNHDIVTGLQFRCSVFEIVFPP